jgi:hypothetical protein
MARGFYYLYARHFGARPRISVDSFKIPNPAI